MKKHVLIPFCSALLLSLSACSFFNSSSSRASSLSEERTSSTDTSNSNDTDASSTGDNSTSSVSTDAYHKVTPNVNTKLTDIADNTPSTGTQPILVFPITFTGTTFTDSELQDIKTLTSGTAEDTHYWESLKSFYQKSSYGQLNLTFTYSDPISLGMSAETFYSTYTKTEDQQDYAAGAAYALKKAVTTYQKNGGDTKPFDTNHDGFIDSVIMIYAQDASPSYDEHMFYWAYRYYDYWNSSCTALSDTIEGNIDKPVGFSYFWASLSFFYQYVGGRSGHGNKIDAHTLIHEFGHMLGADDYYNVDANDSSSTGPSDEPSGCKNMMAFNVMDHDIFNKLQYSWVEPYYVTDNCEITIRPSESTGDCIVLSDLNGWNETAFDEYVIIELYTPTGLNEQDSTTVYPQMSGVWSSSGISRSGIRMWHVDNRLAKADSSGNVTSWYTDAEVKAGNFGDQYYPVIAVSNSESYDNGPAEGKGFNALSLISSLGTKFTSYRPVTNLDLFHTGDHFSLSQSKYQKYFANTSHFNNGNDFPWTIEVVSCDDESATLRFSK